MNHNNDEHSHHAKMQETSVEELELRSWKRKLIGAWIFGVPILILKAVTRIFGITLFSEGIDVAIFLVLGFPVIFIFGFGTLRGGLRGFWTFYFNMDSLIALGTVVAYITGFLSYYGLVADYSGVAG